MQNYQVINIENLAKDKLYQELLSQVSSLIKDERDLVANLGNTAAVLKYNLADTSWVGFYLYKNGELVLGPFQGKPACIRIQPGKGVCGTSFSEERTIIVPDVSKFPGHIYCDPDSKSEIVIPIIEGSRKYGVLDLDSDKLDNYDETDKKYLEKLVELLIICFRNG